MATPRGAKHTDLEQRIRDLEKQVKQLATVALGRQKLAVTEGDFNVSGGGAVHVMYPTGELAVEAGNIDLTGDGNPDGTTIGMRRADGVLNVFSVIAIPPGGAWPDGASEMSLAVDNINMAANTSFVLGVSDGGCLIYGDASGLHISGNPSTTITGPVQVLSDMRAQDVYVEAAPTTSNAPNVYMNASGRLYRTS